MVARTLLLALLVLLALATLGAANHQEDRQLAEADLQDDVLAELSVASDSDAGVDMEAEAELDAEMDAEAEAEAAADAEAEAEVEAETEAETEAEAESAAEKKTELLDAPEDMSDAAMQAKFEEYKVKNRKTYKRPSDEQRAFTLFKRNRMKVYQLNKRVGKKVFSSTGVFSDQDEEAFLKQRSGLRLPAVLPTPPPRVPKKANGPRAIDAVAAANAPVKRRSTGSSAKKTSAPKKSTAAKKTKKSTKKSSASTKKSSLLQVDSQQAPTKCETQYKGFCSTNGSGCREMGKETIFVSANNKLCGDRVSSGSQYGVTWHCCYPKGTVPAPTPSPPTPTPPTPAPAPTPAPPAPAKGIVMEVDWRNIITPVKDQSKCGSCWAHAATQGLESAAGMDAGKPTAVLSPQALMDCRDRPTPSCQGGWPTKAFDRWQREPAVTLEQYPYAEPRFANATCNPVKGTGPKVSQWGYANRPCHSGACKSQDEAAMLKALKKYGPLVVTVHCANWQNYKASVLPGGDEAICSSDPAKLNHAVEIVGYGTEDGTPFWLVRNSWGAAWARSGFIHMEFGKNTCGIANAPVWIDAQ